MNIHDFLMDMGSIFGWCAFAVIVVKHVIGDWK